MQSSGLLNWGSSDPNEPNSTPAAKLVYTLILRLLEPQDRGPGDLHRSVTANRKIMQLNSKIDIRASGGIEPLRQVYDHAVEERQGGQGMSWFVPTFNAAGELAEDDPLFDEFMSQAERSRPALPCDQGRRRQELDDKSRRLARPMQLTDRIELALALVATAPRLAYDIETDWARADCRVVGYAFVGRPRRRLRAGAAPVRQRRRRLSNSSGPSLAFANARVRVLLTIGFNIGFDLFHSGRYGVWPGAPVEDAQINEVLIYEYHRAYDSPTAWNGAGSPGKDDEALIDRLGERFGGARTRSVQMQNFWRLPGDEPARLGLRRERTSSAPIALWARAAGGDHRPDAQGNTLERVHRLECDLIPHLARMRVKGIRVDKSYAEQAIALLERQIDRGPASTSRRALTRPALLSCMSG